MKRSRLSKNAKIAVSTLIVIIVGLLLAAALIIPGVRTLFRVKGSFDSLGPGACTEGDKLVPVAEYKNNIRNYALRIDDENQQNVLYSPSDAVRQFKTFFACQKEGAFSDEQLTEHKREIIDNTHAAYISWGEDICREYCNPNINRDEQKELDDKRNDLIEDYYDTFDELERTPAFREIVANRLQYTGASSCANVRCN